MSQSVKTRRAGVAFVGGFVGAVVVALVVWWLLDLVGVGKAAVIGPVAVMVAALGYMFFYAGSKQGAGKS